VEPITYQLQGMPNGKAGVRFTLRKMGDIANAYKTDPTIRELAIRIIANVPEKSWHGQARAILRFVQERIKYLEDVVGVETLQTPIQTLRLGHGDCDDKSILFASLMMAIGKPVRFVAIGRVKGHFEHVFPQVKIGNEWVSAETIYRWPLGKTPPNFQDYMEHHI
jgi:transglutaminase-like putative cysteine protease